MNFRRTANRSGPPTAHDTVTGPVESAGPDPGSLGRLTAAQRRAVRENVAAVAWLAATVLDAEPGLRPVRYRDAFEQARAAGIATGDLPADYHRGLDLLLRRYLGQANTILAQLGDREG